MKLRYSGPDGLSVLGIQLKHGAQVEASGEQAKQLLAMRWFTKVSESGREGRKRRSTSSRRRSAPKQEPKKEPGVPDEPAAQPQPTPETIPEPEGAES